MAKKIRDETKEMLRNKAKQNAKRFISRNKIDEEYDSSVADLFKKMYVTIYLSLYHQQLTDLNTKTKQALMEANKLIADLKNTKTICPCGDWDDDFHTCRAYKNDDEWQKDIEERDYYKKHYIKALKLLNTTLDKAENFCDRSRPGLFMDVFGKESQWAKSHEKNINKELTNEDFIASNDMKIMGSESFRVVHKEPIIQEILPHKEDSVQSEEIPAACFVGDGVSRGYKSWDELTPMDKAIYKFTGGKLINCYWDKRNSDKPMTPVIREVDNQKNRNMNDRITYVVGPEQINVWYLDPVEGRSKIKEMTLRTETVKNYIKEHA